MISVIEAKRCFSALAGPRSHRITSNASVWPRLSQMRCLQLGTVSALPSPCRKARGGSEGVRIPLHTHIYASDASSHSHLSAKSHTWTPVNSGFKRFFALKIAKFSLKSAERAATRAWQTNSEPGRHGRKYSHFRAASSPAPARRRRAGDPHGRPGLTSENCDRSHTHTYTSKPVSHSHLTP